MSATVTPYQSALPVTPDRFAHLVRAEFTKLRTVRGWIAGLLLGALLIFGIGFLSTSGSHQACRTPNGKVCAAQMPLLGPGGQVITDSFYFVHQQWASDGSITARITSLGEQIMRPDAGAPDDPSSWEPGVVPWAKAGLMVKLNTTQGSPYVAIMVTASHGVRMQYAYTHDVAGSATVVTKTSPRWLRLTRAGDSLTGYESADGVTWVKVGGTSLAGLPPSAQVGMFVASPDHSVTTQIVIGTSTEGGPAKATATFDDVDLQSVSTASWQGTRVGDGGAGDLPRFTQSAGTFTVTGSGDVGPMASDGGDDNTVSGSLIGVFVGLVAVVVIGALFITAEYRRGLIRSTLIASPRRGRVLAAKAVVLGGVVFVLGLATSAFTMWFVNRQRRHNGTYIVAANSVTEIRVLVGTAALLAVSSVFAVAVGTIVRRSATAVAAVIALVVLPYVLAVSSVGAMQWLLRLMPTAGFAVQGTLHRYPQVDGVYIASAGYYPLSPWAGFGVLLGWTAVALGVATFLLRRRDT